MKNDQTCISVRWENQLKRRYYRVIIHQDVFGVWVLMRVWGGIQQAGGGTQITVLENKHQGMDILESISETRQKHGYKLVKNM